MVVKTEDKPHKEWEEIGPARQVAEVGDGSYNPLSILLRLVSI
jgi:hypothetical protein